MCETKESTWLPPMANLNTLVLLLSLISVYVAWIVLTSTFLHPLGRFPGPHINATTKLPYWFASLRGNQVRWMRQLHARYGPIVRFGPNDLSYTDPQAWKDIYTYQKGKKENPKDKMFYPELENGVCAVADIPDAKRHAVVRRAMAPAFSDRAIKEQENIFQDYAELMIENIRRAVQDKGFVEMVKTYNLTTFDIMAELVYGESLSLLKTGEYTPWVELVFKSISFLPLIQVMRHYPILKLLFNMLEPKSVRDIRLSHHQYCNSRLNKTLAGGSEHANLWNSVLLKNKEDGVITMPELQTNVQLFMTAGTETSATLLSGLTYLLLTNPRSMKLLTEELRSTPKLQMDFESLARLPYLNACIEEGLRLYPPVPQGFPRTIAEGGNMVLGQWLPEGTSVTVSTTSAYRDPNNFRDPDTFVPERWMGDPRYKDDRRDARQPFSYGPRNCLGMGMAWHEMRLLLTKVLYNFDLKLCDESQDWADQKNYILWQKKPLICKITLIKDT